MTEILALEFMRNAIIGAVLVGFAAPLVGIFLVQRRMSLIGDGMGHVALAGVAVGVLTGTQPVWTALIAAVLAAVAIELLRVRGGTSGDIALALMFYGGIALGVVLMGLAPSASSTNLTGFLFGAILTTTQGDLWAFAILSVLVVGTVTVLRKRLFAVANDEEYARATGLPVTGLNLVLAVLTAVTVVVSMRIVGLLLISALMILPNAAAQRIGSSFAGTMRWAALIGVTAALAGVVTSYYAGTASGGTIVLILIAAFVAIALGAALARRLAARGHRLASLHHHEHGPDCGHEAIPHGDHVDYLHDGHRHAAHEGHYDEHHPDPAHHHEDDHQGKDHHEADRQSEEIR